MRTTRQVHPMRLICLGHPLKPMQRLMTEIMGKGGDFDLWITEVPGDPPALMAVAKSAKTADEHLAAAHAAAEEASRLIARDLAWRGVESYVLLGWGAGPVRLHKTAPAFGHDVVGLSILLVEEQKLLSDHLLVWTETAERMRAVQRHLHGVKVN